MPIYTYETIPQRRGGRVRRFEVRRSIHDAPLQTAPDSDEPVRRVITGGITVRAGKRATGMRPGAGDVTLGECCPGCHD
jgi:hypothetical protein